MDINETTMRCYGCGGIARYERSDDKQYDVYLCEICGVIWRRPQGNRGISRDKSVYYITKALFEAESKITEAAREIRFLGDVRQVDMVSHLLREIYIIIQKVS